MSEAEMDTENGKSGSDCKSSVSKKTLLHSPDLHVTNCVKKLKTESEHRYPGTKPEDMEKKYQLFCTITCPNNISTLKESFTMKAQGSEAKIYEGKYFEKEAILKERFQKKYRHVELDKILTAERTKAEVRALNKCFEIGVKCPAVYFADLQTGCIILEKIQNAVTVKELLADYYEKNGMAGIEELIPLAHKIGSVIAKMHKNELVHGDLTTSNMLVKKDFTQARVANVFSNDLFFIDFGLSKRDIVLEDKAVDLYVLERAISSSHPEAEIFYTSITKEYSKSGNKAVLNKLEEVRQRGRKRSMVG